VIAEINNLINLILDTENYIHNGRALVGLVSIFWEIQEWRLKITSTFVY